MEFDGRHFKRRRGRSLCQIYRRGQKQESSQGNDLLHRSLLSFIVLSMAIIAVLGRKGGIGKSTIVGNLAGEFVAMGRNVVALDADPQHSLAAWASQGAGTLSRIVEKVKTDTAEALDAKVRKVQKGADLVLIDTPPGIPEVGYQAALVADLVLLPCGPSPLELYALKEALAEVLKARAERRSKKPRIRFVPSRVLMGTNLGRSLSSALEVMGKKLLPAIGQRIVVAEAVTNGLTVGEYAPGSVAHSEFEALAKAVDEIVSR
jgi:chromosome partitioning protein